MPILHLLFHLLLVTFTFTGCSGCGNSSSSNAPADGSPETVTITITNSTSRAFDVSAELARTDEERAVGLSNRDSLEENHGMLFIFEAEEQWSFWMKDTLIPLDMIFIDTAGKIVDINHSATPLSLQSYTSSAPAKFVLEVNGGYCNENSITEGDSVAPLDKY